MAFFSKPDQPPLDAEANNNAPLTRDRIEEVLKSRDYRYFIDSDGDVGGSWDGHMFYFFRYGQNSEILQIRGRWNRELPANLNPQVLVAINEWHQEKIWPKLYTAITDDQLAVYSEFSVDLEAGVSDEQLSLILSVGISPSCSAFDFLDQRFPAVINPN